MIEKKSSNWVKIGMSTCGLAAGAQEVYDCIKEEIEKRKLDVVVKKVGCLGMCSLEPLVEVNVLGTQRVIYGNVTVPIAKKIVNNHLRDKRLVQDHIIHFKEDSL
jgi:(2Fe-2S) ferredoxin